MTSEVAELLNGMMFILSLCLLFTFARYLWGDWCWPLMRRQQAAVAILVFMTGEAVRGGWTWAWRYMGNEGVNVQWMRDVPVLLMAAMLLLSGALLMIRAFTPNTCGHRSWIISGILSVGVTVAIYCTH
jgi:uncharacterized membrane protein SirB2